MRAARMASLSTAVTPGSEGSASAVNVAPHDEQLETAPWSSAEHHGQCATAISDVC